MFNNTRLTPALFFLFVVFCLLLPSLDVAQASEGQGDAKMCISDSTRSMKDSSGTEKGIDQTSNLCVDHGTFRQPTLIADDGVSLTLGQIRWGGASPKPAQETNDSRKFFWRNAKIVPEMVEDVFFVERPFPPEAIAAHVFLVFTFKRGGFESLSESDPVPAQNNSSKLNSKKRSNRHGAVKDLSEALVVSFEAVRKQGEPFDLWLKGTTRKYGLTCVMSTWENYACVDCDLQGNRYLLWRFQLSSEQKTRLVRAAIAEGLRNLSGDFYHTLANSCLTNAIPIIDSVLPKNQQIPLHIGNSKVLNPLATQPKMIPGAFIKKGVLAPNCVNVTAANWFVPLQDLAGPSVVSQKQN